MRAFAAKLLRLLCAVALLAGATLDGACAAAMAAQAKPAPTAPATGSHTHDCGMNVPAQDTGNSTTPDPTPANLLCCHALGSAASAIPSATNQPIPPPLARTVRYWASAEHPAGRAIAPALGPPRPV